ncbi:MAG: response regulator [Oscillatoriaceae bacterium SKW80]|nr:response regulator [Oscillatoriaceae bacterium SKYG93]MCX8120965.1 response regulator [Oscillatoriaceae bacterium SKW80]MDW8452238.1 response regulator [Oscillatoriaceae cyanobacterium SKYGB_i_bin93]HIK26573.1 response regulator [Oscillatoriaceae cyanobacterium M7585_C2015_266]
MKILLVEDDEAIARMLLNVLAEQHHTLDVASDGQKGWELAEAFTYDLIVLDVVLPHLDGITLCRRLRARRLTMPILLLTCRNSSDDKVIGFDAGADDYVVKPFDPQELVARIRALLRRGGSSLPPVLEWGELHLDPSTCEVTYGKQLLHLTPKEYSLLELFMRNSSRVFSSSAILEQLWSFEEPPSEETVRAHIKGLRQKLKMAGAPTDLIETVYGLGYRLKPQTTPPSKSQAFSIAGVPSAPKELNLQAEDQSKSTNVCVLPPSETKNTKYDNFKTSLKQLWERFKEPVIRRMDIVETAIAALSAGTLNSELKTKAISEVHKLAGCLGTFGFALGSEIARQIEHLLQAEFLTPEQAPELQKLIQQMRANIQPDETTLAPCTQPTILLVIDNDSELTEKLVAQGIAAGLKVKTSLTSAALEVLKTHPVDAVLLDLSYPETAEKGISLLNHLSKQIPPIPVLVLSDKDYFAYQLETARRGSRTFLRKPVSPTIVINLLYNILRRCQTNQTKILILDEDIQTLATIQTLLKPRGFKIITLEDANLFWETLKSYLPDILILDMQMSAVNSIELCQKVRNHQIWNNLPILFLTHHTDADIVHQIFTCGADDYVSKPIIGSELITRLLNCLERTQLLRNWMETDALTGVANRYKSLQDLAQLLHQADCYTQPLCFALLDLDHFKQVNDLYGHVAGDNVLRHFGKLLMQMFNSQDIVARWGGEEFVVGMYGMSKESGIKRLTDFLQNWRKQLFLAASGQQFYVSFSAGVVEYPQDGSEIQTLYLNADSALSQAKLEGGDRVVYFSPT